MTLPCRNGILKTSTSQYIVLISLRYWLTANMLQCAPSPSSPRQNIPKNISSPPRTGFHTERGGLESPTPNLEIEYGYCWWHGINISYLILHVTGHKYVSFKMLFGKLSQIVSAI